MGSITLWFLESQKYYQSLGLLKYINVSRPTLNSQLTAIFQKWHNLRVTQKISIYCNKCFRYSLQQCFYQWIETFSFHLEFLRYCIMCIFTICFPNDKVINFEILNLENLAFLSSRFYMQWKYYFYTLQHFGIGSIRQT